MENSRRNPPRGSQKGGKEVISTLSTQDLLILSRGRVFGDCNLFLLVVGSSFHFLLTEEEIFE
jgi:hypothetical protein